jgi:anti-anti-sigma factor
MDTISLLAVERVGDVTLVRLTRPLCLSGGLADVVNEQLASLGAGPGRRLVFNLANVTSLASRMLSHLVVLFGALRDAGGSLALCAPAAVIREILDVTGLTRLICVYDTESAALRARPLPRAV